MANHRDEAVENAIELWKAIHGGCWPVGAPDIRLAEFARNVLISLALFDVSRGIEDKQVAKAVVQQATQQLNSATKSIVAYTSEFGH